MSVKVAIIGGGSWGSTVASMVARNNQAVIWARNTATVAEINELHTNTKYLKDAKLSPKLVATADLKDAVRDADLLILAVPSHGLRDIVLEIKSYIRSFIPVVSLTKGLEKGTNKRMTEIITDVLPGHPVGVLSGPNLAAEIMLGQAAASVLAMHDAEVARELQPILSTSVFRVYINDDLVGCELGGVLKNVIAIAVGIGDGMGAGDNTRAALITRGLSEVTRLGIALGGKAETFAGLAGMGDMIATCTSEKSRNRTVGYKLGQGQDIKSITDEMVMVAEGVKSVGAVLELAESYGVEMPIAKFVYNVVVENVSARDAFRSILRIGAGAEWEPG
jgi:glycerol-3-phosphate dehydrogenase (NAD(P)+)